MIRGWRGEARMCRERSQERARICAAAQDYLLSLVRQHHPPIENTTTNPQTNDQFNRSCPNATHTTYFITWMAECLTSSMNPSASEPNVVFVQGHTPPATLHHRLAWHHCCFLKAQGLWRCCCTLWGRRGCDPEHRESRHSE